MKNSDVLYLTGRSTEQCQPEHKNHQRIEQLKESKLNKNKLIAKTLEAFKPQAKFFAFKTSYCKNIFKTNFCFWNRSSIISVRPEKYSLKFDSLKNNQKISEKKKSIANYKERLLKIVIEKSSEPFLSLEAIQ